MLVSALSETLDRIAVPAARKVFVDAFLANREGWRVEIPTVPLDELYGSHLTEWLTRRGVTIRLQSGAGRLLIDEDTASAVELRNGERLSADDFIIAVPHHSVLALLPESLQAHPQLSGIAELESAPISSVHLWFDRPITSLPHAVFVGRLSQWMFNRTVLQSSHADLTEKGLFYYQTVISASRTLAEKSQQQTIDEVVGDLAAVWPTTVEAKLVHSRLVTEHKAVFSAKPGADKLRPVGQSPIANLQLAGDWTRTGWPATMEGAVRSGYLAAEDVLARRGQMEKLMQPDLPAGLLSKLLLGL
jgi:squalene-associated FAD-dependent desaturase